MFFFSLKIKAKRKGGFLKWKLTDTSDATSITAHIIARTATAAALTISKSEATKPTPPNQNAPTADPLNIRADFSAEKAVYIYFHELLKIFFARTRSDFLMQPRSRREK